MNPYDPEVDWFTREPELHSLHQGPEPKRRFMPSKWEEKKCAPAACPAICVPLRKPISNVILCQANDPLCVCPASACYDLPESEATAILSVRW